MLAINSMTGEETNAWGVLRACAHVEHFTEPVPAVFRWTSNPANFKNRAVRCILISKMFRCGNLSLRTGGYVPSLLFWSHGGLTLETGDILGHTVQFNVSFGGPLTKDICGGSFYKVKTMPFMRCGLCSVSISGNVFLPSKLRRRAWSSSVWMGTSVPPFKWQTIRASPLPHRGCFPCGCPPCSQSQTLSEEESSGLPV